MMSRLVINGFDDFVKHVDQSLGSSEYLKVTQAQINKFAEATIDHQWIHTDPERAKKEGPFGGPIAHGYLTLSLVPYLWNQIIEVNNLKMMINYGIEKLRFSQPVPAEAEMKLHAHLRSVVNLRGITKAEVDAKMEIKGNDKPAFTATLIFLYHFHA
jgi:acyl dehydratase